MALIKSQLVLTDGMTGPLKSINKAMNIVLNSFEAMQDASGRAIDTASIQEAREELARASAALDQLEDHIPIEYIEGLATAELTSIVINGEDEEATETLRLRYLNSFENQSYGFNRGQYIEVTEALPGVGGCKPYRAWKGPGTVKLVITGSDYQPPSDTLINTVQTTIDPTQNSGDGIGLAPIDHEVTVVGAAGTTVNISTTLTFASGWNLTECLPYIQSALDAYYLELNSTWSKEAGLIVRVSQIESRLLALAGIVDISGTTLNGQAGNLTLDKDAVAVRGSFTNA